MYMFVHLGGRGGQKSEKNGHMICEWPLILDQIMSKNLDHRYLENKLLFLEVCLPQLQNIILFYSKARLKYVSSNFLTYVLYYYISTMYYVVVVHVSHWAVFFKKKWKINSFSLHIGILTRKVNLQLFPDLCRVFKLHYKELTFLHRFPLI